MTASHEHPHGSDADPQQLIAGARTIVAYTREDDGARQVRELALRTAARSGARVVLYPLDVGSPFSNPVPSNWSGGEGEQQRALSNPLGVSDLELLGREELAAQLVEASGSGVDAVAWLPEEPGVAAMATYAERLGADVILIPADLDEPTPLARLVGQEEPGEVAEERPAMTIIRVDRDGQLRTE